MAAITPCLWFEGDVADEAATFYASVIPKSSVDEVVRSPVDTPSGSAGNVLLVRVTINGTPFIALNGRSGHPFTMAISFQIHCADQAECDRLWEDLIAGGGEHSQCGWLTDRFGVAWQVIPQGMEEFLSGPDERGSARAFEAMMGMTRLDLDRIRRAYEGLD
jgi:predicted 3-demethylubiquinone-9 3-methyltransferase (glyoxalase superfamily)